MGGGPAGAACALQLARSGARVALLTKRDRTPLHPPELISPEALGLLDEQGFDRIGAIALGPRSYGGTAIWSGDPHHWSDIVHPDGGGVFLDRSVFDAWMRQTAIARGVHTFADVNGAEVERDGARWAVMCRAGGRMLRVMADWVIDATGRRAAFAVTQGASRITRNDLIAVARSTDERPSPAEFIVETVRSGWWYAMPSAERYAAVFVTSPSQLRRSRQPILEAWCDAYAASRLLRGRLPTGARWSAVCTMAAGPGRLDVVHGERWVAIGDAASHVDPLEGRGVARALEGAGWAAQAISSEAPQAALDEYAERVHTAFARHLVERQRLYQMVRDVIQLSEPVSL